MRKIQWIFNILATLIILPVVAPLILWWEFTNKKQEKCCQACDYWDHEANGVH